METQEPEVAVRAITETTLVAASTCLEPMIVPLEQEHNDATRFLETETSSRLESKVDDESKPVDQRITSNENSSTIKHGEKVTDLIENAEVMSKSSSAVIVESEREESDQCSKPTFHDQESTSTVINIEIAAERPNEIPSLFCHNEEHEDTIKNAEIAAEGSSGTSKLTYIDDEHTVARETGDDDGVHKSSSYTHHNLDTEVTNKADTTAEVLNSDSQSAKTQGHYPKSSIDLTVKTEEAVQGEHNLDDQSVNSPRKGVMAKGGIEDFQDHPKQEDGILEKNTKSCGKSSQPAIASGLLVPIPNATVSDPSSHQPASLGMPHSGSRSLLWRTLIEKGIGMHTDTRKGVKNQLEQAGNQREAVPKSAKGISVVFQAGHEDARQTDQVEKRNKDQIGHNGINGSAIAPHSATNNDKSQKSGTYRLKRGNRKNVTRGTKSPVEIQKEESVAFQRQFQQYQQPSPNEKFRPDGQHRSQGNQCKIRDEYDVSVSKSETPCELTSENIEVENPEKQELSKNSTSHDNARQPMTEGRKKKFKKPRKVVPGLKGTPSTTVIEPMVESQERVFINTASEKITPAVTSSRKPDMTLQPPVQTESPSSINHSCMKMNHEYLKKPTNHLNQTNQNSPGHSNQLAKMSADGVGRIGRGARGRNSGRTGIVHQVSSENQQPSYKVEQGPQSTGRRQRGFQPQGPTSSNAGASDHSNQEFSVEKQRKTENSINGNTADTNTNTLGDNSSLVKQATHKSTIPEDQEVTSAKKPTEESPIIMDSSQSENLKYKPQSYVSVNSLNFKSPEGNSNIFPIRDIANSDGSTRLDGRQKGVRASFSQKLKFMDDQSSIVPNGNWDSSDNVVQPRGENVLTYRIDLRKIPKYKFQGPPSSAVRIQNTPAEIATNAKANANSPPNQSAPEKKTVPAPSTSAQKSDGVLSPKSMAKGIAEDSYVPPHLRVPTPKVAIPKTLVAVPKIFKLKSPPKSERADNRTKVDVAENDSNVPQISNDKGKEKAKDANGNIRGNGPLSGPTEPIPTVILPNNELSAKPHPLAGQDGRLSLLHDEWIGRRSFNSRALQHVQAMDVWMAEQVSEAVNNPISLNINDPGFETGEAPTTGEIELAEPIDSKLHETHLPDDDFTHAKHNETAADAAKKLRFKVRQDRFETKAERKAYREAIKLAEASYVLPPNPHVPLANIYLRPAETRDLRKITEIYNHYVASSVVVAEREPMDERQWLARWNDAKDQRHAFVVAVQMSHKGGGYSRRNSDEVLTGFAYADDYGNNVNAYRYTAELQFYVANWIPRSGVGKSLVDRMLAALDPCYYFRNGARFEGGENYIWYEQGGVRLIKKVIISIPYAVKDDSALKWQKEWLAQFGFEQVATMPGVGYKFGKEINVAILMKETGTTVPMGT